MRDPITDLVVKELTEIAIQYLCERELRETCEAIDAFAVWSRKRIQSWIWPAEPIHLEWRPPVRKRGRPPQRRNRHLQIAGAVAMLVEDAGLRPTRSHALRRRCDPSACSIVAAALEQRHEYLGEYLGECRGERLSERTVEDIWNRYRRSPLINYPKATDYARNHRYRVSS
jgi:hypothetical protein